MEANEEIEMQLWEYLDGTCNVPDMQRISILIERDSVWKQKYGELSALHSGIANSMELEQPSMRFTQNVMDMVAAQHIAPATTKYINKNIIRGIAALFITMLAVIFGYALANSGTGTKGALPKLDLSKVNLGGIFSSTTMTMIIMINIIIGLVLFDTILRRKRTPHIQNGGTH